MSRTLTPAGQNWPVLEREVLAIRESLLKWRHYLHGVSHPITVLTGHRNTLAIARSRTSKPRLARWTLDFDEFNLQLVYRPGSLNSPADALSRKVQGFTGTIDRPLFTLRAPPSPLQISTVRLTRQWMAALASAHSFHIGGHAGTLLTLQSLRDLGLAWDGCSSDVKQFVRQCVVCQSQKTTNQRPSGLLFPHHVPPWPWHTIALDFLSGFQPCKGFSVILTITDCYSKFVHFLPFRSLPSTLELCEALLSGAFCFHGLPLCIISDRGPQFASSLARFLTRRLGISQNLSSSFHLQTDGQSELTKRTLLAYLRCFSGALQDNWVDLLPLAELWFNSSFCPAVNSLPAEVLFGRKLVLGGGLVWLRQRFLFLFLDGLGMF